jgi:AcrR family transcriptional regulator
MTAEGNGMRARAREAVTCALADLALDMFDQHGYDTVTVADIAKAADISSRSFFRNFPNKDDVVFGSRMPTAQAVVDAYLSHPESPWEALRLTFRGAGVEMDLVADSWKQIMRIISSSSELRAKNLERHIAWAVALMPHVEKSITDSNPRRLADITINTALTCFDVALRTWSQSDGATPLAEIIDDTFAQVQVHAAG